MAEETAGFRITGVVQGVGFRLWTQRRGLELGLRGIVANRADGSVEARVTGGADAIRAFERSLARGPSGARVRSVDRIGSVLEIPPSGFAIQR